MKDNGVRMCQLIYISSGLKTYLEISHPASACNLIGYHVRLKLCTKTVCVKCVTRSVG